MWNGSVAVYTVIQHAVQADTANTTSERERGRGVDKEQHFELLRESAAQVKELQDQLQSIRDQEAALQAQRVTTLEQLKKARDERFKRMTAAIDDRVPKAQIARELGMDRTNLYKLLDGKDDGPDA